MATWWQTAGRRRATRSISARTAGLHVVGCARGPHRHRRQPGQVGVGEVVGRAHRGVLGGQPRAEQQRVVGTERDRRAGLEQRGQRHGGEVGVHAERDVGDRADLERDPGVDHPGQQVGVLDRADAVTEPAGVEQVDARGAPTRVRSAHRRGAPAAGRPARRSRTRARTPRSRRVARRWRARSRRRRGRRTGRRAGPACARPGGAGCGWRRSPPRSRARSWPRSSRTASRTRSVNAVIPPKRAPYPDGSTWISSQRPPSRTSSSAASRTSRRTSSSVRSTDRATS